MFKVIVTGGKDFKDLKLIKVADGEMSSEELREEIMTEYRADTEEKLHYRKNH